MSILSSVRPFTRLLLTSAVLLILYSYLCRLWKIYFFWESGSAGFLLLLIGLILFLFQRINSQTAQHRSTILEKLVVSILCFGTILWLVIAATFLYSDAHAVARHVILHDTQLKSNIGLIHRVVIQPVGQIQLHVSDAGEIGTAQLSLIAEGEQKFQDLEVFLAKEPSDTAWVVREIIRE